MGERMPTKKEVVELLCRLADFSELMLRQRVSLATVAKDVATYLWVNNVAENDDTRKLRELLRRINDGEYLSQEPAHD